MGAVRPCTSGPRSHGVHSARRVWTRSKPCLAGGEVSRRHLLVPGALKPHVPFALLAQERVAGDQLPARSPPCPPPCTRSPTPLRTRTRPPPGPQPRGAARRLFTDKETEAPSASPGARSPKGHARPKPPTARVGETGWGSPASSAGLATLAWRRGVVEPTHLFPSSPPSLPVTSGKQSNPTPRHLLAEDGDAGSHVTAVFVIAPNENHLKCLSAGDRTNKLAHAWPETARWTGVDGRQG